MNFASGLKNWLESLWLKLQVPEFKRVQSFTFYLPAPTQNRKGFREKQFDTLFKNFLNLGFKIIKYNITQLNRGDQAAIYLCFIVKAQTFEALRYCPENFENLATPIGGQTLSDIENTSGNIPLE